MDALTPKQQALVEQYRDWNVDVPEWWTECIIDELVEDMATKGIITSRDEVHWSGFWCQGDGACFTGRIDLPAFIKAHALADCYPAHALMFCTTPRDDQARLIHSGNYYHEHSISLEIDTVDEECPTDELVKAAMWEVATKLLPQEAGFQDAILEQCRSYMSLLYNTLEKEYEYQTSDEAVWESLCANEMENETPKGWVDEEDEDIPCALVA